MDIPIEVALKISDYPRFAQEDGVGRLLMLLEEGLLTVIVNETQTGPNLWAAWLDGKYMLEHGHRSGSWSRMIDAATRCRDDPDQLSLALKLLNDAIRAERSAATTIAAALIVFNSGYDREGLALIAKMQGLDKAASLLRPQTVGQK